MPYMATYIAIFGSISIYATMPFHIAIYGTIYGHISDVTYESIQKQSFMSGGLPV